MLMNNYDLNTWEMEGKGEQFKFILSYIRNSRLATPSQNKNSPLFATVVVNEESTRKLA